MQYTLDVSEKAEQHIEAAFLWYEQQKAGLGNTFLESIDSSFVSIQANPLAFGYRKNKVRGCIVRPFPFLVLFYVRKHSIRIVAVFHTSRNPEKLLKR